MTRTIVSLSLMLSLVLFVPAATSSDTSPKLTDAQITLAVGDALLTRHGVPGYVIDVATENGIVKLGGKVNNIMAKQRAAAVAKTVRGVRAVVNRIDVADTQRSDDQIRSDVETALAFDPATESWEIAATVSDSLVTLTGSVDSWQEKQLAAKVAKSVRGVQGLRNDIAIDYDMDRPDTEIRSEVVQRLRWDALVDDALINVRVRDDDVTLSGTVGSAAEKTRAVADAWVMGVDSVSAEDLDVAVWARDERFRTEKYVDKSDQAVRKAVKDALAYAPRVTTENVKIEADAGVVTLSGKTNNLKSKRQAASTAKNVVGVWRVKNKINVRPSTPTDETIEERIENALLRDPYVNRYEINVSVVNGEANLYGTVDSYYEKAQADDAAAGVYGVVEVDNNLAVDDVVDPLIYDPYVDPDWYYDYDWYTYTPAYETAKTDWEIREDVNDELWWSPFVDSDEVNVAVDNGVATLTGTVDTWNERQAATENAYEGGAVSVDNDLAVNYGPDVEAYEY